MESLNCITKKIANEISRDSEEFQAMKLRKFQFKAIRSLVGRLHQQHVPLADCQSSPSHSFLRSTKPRRFAVE